MDRSVLAGTWENFPQECRAVCDRGGQQFYSRETQG